MTETLTIRNFGPIKDVTIDIRKVTVLIGEQGTGKSTIVKLLNICRYFSFITDFDYFEKERNAFSFGLLSINLMEYINENTYLHYSCKHYSIEGITAKIKYDPTLGHDEHLFNYELKVNLEPKSDEFKKLLADLKKIHGGEEYFSLSETPVSFFQNNVAKVMDNPFYLPAERGLQSIFSLGKSSIQNLSDTLFNQLAKLDNISRRFNEETEIRPLGIFYKNVNGSGLVKKRESNSYYSLSGGASDYQSTIPVVLAIKYYSQIRKKSKTFFIEEPELHLFPNAQSLLVDYIVEHTNVYGHSMLVTTHSPYILASLNNLMSAHNAGRLDKKDTSKVIPEKCWLNPDEVSAYMLHNGTCEDIMDRDENMIKAEKIDGISGILNEQFDKLLGIEFEHKK